MWELIKSFFSSLFGTEQVIIEDASDLEESPVIISEEQPSEAEMQERMRSRGLGRSGTRSIVIGEVIDADGDGGSEEVVTISSPRFLWLLDNGHGELQNGKRSPHFADGTRFEEWEFNRDVVRKMILKLEAAGVQFINLVPEDKVGSFLSERVGRANAAKSELGLPRIFVSIHANALGMNEWRNGSKGIETWHYPGNNTGMKLASVFQDEIMKALPGWVDRGIKSHQRGSRKIFYVLRNTAMPAVLTENGFYTDENEAALLMKDEIRQAIADAHVNAILKVEMEGYDNIPIYKPRMVIA
ncbi:MAG: N-acetylmuramoyl-L-alanine amidase [Bacteroidota bacterium]